MTRTLNITNGDCAVQIMKNAGFDGVFLPWRDVLHDGPVPQDLSLSELSKVRAKFIYECGWGAKEDVKRSFAERDELLASFKGYEKIILWFEHDLYDQLQIIQILDWFHTRITSEVALSMVCTNQYLGRLSPSDMASLGQHEKPVTDSQLALSSKAWSAFTDSSPEKWCGLLTEDTTALPFLEGAIIRLLEEYPSCQNGLSRSAEQALRVISEGEQLAGRVFAGTQKLEQRVFMGDSSFWLILRELLDSAPPLITLPKGVTLTLPTASGQVLSITSEGLECLNGNISWLNISNIDRWIGGVHIVSGYVWCWDSNARTVIKLR